MCASPRPRRRDEDHGTCLERVAGSRHLSWGWWPHSFSWAFGWARTAHCTLGQGLQPQTLPEEDTCVEVGHQLARGWPHRRPSERRGVVLTVGRAGLASVPPCPEPSSPRASGTGRTRPWRHRAPTACRSPGRCPASIRTRSLAQLLSRVMSDGGFVPLRED